jgi:hypothetical protein
MNSKISGVISGVIIALAASLLIISTAVCDSSSASPGAIRLEQPGTTDYMRSQVGTPDELSPLAPAEARNVHKVRDQWVCEVNGQTMVYNNATACWEPQHK